jgi:hypothetical protein
MIGKMVNPKKPIKLGKKPKHRNRLKMPYEQALVYQEMDNIQKSPDNLNIYNRHRHYLKKWKLF